MTPFEQGNKSEFIIPDDLSGLDEDLKHEAFVSLNNRLKQLGINSHALSFFTIDRVDRPRSRILTQGLRLSLDNGKAGMGQRITFNREAEDMYGHMWLEIDDYVLSNSEEKLYHWHDEIECHPNYYGEPEPVMTRTAPPVIYGDPVNPVILIGSHYDSETMTDLFNNNSGNSLLDIQDLENGLADLDEPDEIIGYDIAVIR